MLLSIEKYAKKCGCTGSNIRSRIKNKLIKLKMKTLPDGSKQGYIDTKVYPPLRVRKSGGGRKPKKKTRKVKLKNAA
jgi:hypothetical protein